MRTLIYNGGYSAVLLVGGTWQRYSKRGKRCIVQNVQSPRPRSAQKARPALATFCYSDLIIDLTFVTALKSKGIITYNVENKKNIYIHYFVYSYHCSYVKTDILNIDTPC